MAIPDPATAKRRLKMKSVITVLLIIAATLILGGCVVLNLARFGAAPDAQQQKAYTGSANYNTGEQAFHN